MKSDRRQTIIFIIILLVLSLGIGYAFLTTTLSIEGVSDIDASGWDVHFDNLTIDGSSNLPSSQIYTPATISADGKTITYHIKINELDDRYAFNFDIVNSGTMDAKLESFSLLINDGAITSIPNFLIFDFDINQELEQVLLAGESLHLHYKVGFNSALRPEDLPSEDYSLNFSISMNYVQTSIGNLLYGKNGTVHLGEKLTSGNRYYEDYNEFVNTNLDVFHKYILDDNHIITDAYIGFAFGGNIYYLRCGKSTFNSSTNEYNNDSPYYEANKDILISAFGASNCQDYDNGNGYSCHNNNDIHKMYIVRKDGYMLISASGYGSNFLPDGTLNRVMITS